MTDKKGGQLGAESRSSEEGNITFEDLGITRGDRGVVQTPVGQRRSLADVSWVEWIFLFLSCISILVVIALTIIRLVQLIETSNNQPTPSPTPNIEVTTDTTFAILLLFNAVYILFYVINGVFGERANELLIFVAGVFIVLAYCIINYIGSTSQTVKLVRLVLISAVGPVVTIMALYIAKQYYDSRNLIFRTVGANIELQDMCQYMFLCESLLKFDLQLVVSMVILVLEDGVMKIDLLEKLVVGLGIPYGVFWALIGFLAMRYENKTLTWVFFITSIGEPAYIVYKLVDVAMNKTDSLLDDAIIVCAVLGLVVRVAVVLCMAKVYSNFGKGLKEKAFGDEGAADTKAIATTTSNNDNGEPGYQTSG